MLQQIMGRLRRAGMVTWGLIALSVSSPLAAHAADWFALGPYGGNVRSLAADPLNPKHVYLGTATGWVYDSEDGGATWRRLALLSRSEDLVISRILVDSSNAKRLVVSTFRFDRPDGGVYLSEDGGKNWYVQAQMRGQSVRSLARSASDPKQLVAGTLQGVFHSKDGGTHWEQISPAGSTELHEVESVAIDPADPNVIYAGTWHLPWKTTDGGATWVNIKEGVIDDSDVFSIIVDANDPRVVYASACSGIYKSKSAAELITDAAFCKRTGGTCRFEKVQGIPTLARRTRKLLMDPNNSKIVFAGTTEGLYRTTDAGAQWLLTTGPDVIINDVYVDPSNSQHVLLATDRGGVLSSEDGGDTFQPSNMGFSARQVLAFAADAQSPGTLYVGVVNDKESGGVFQSVDGGVKWEQQSTGLGGRDVFSLAQTASGTLLAGTSHGVYRLEAGTWTDSDAMDVPATAKASASIEAPVPSATEPPAPAKPLAAAKRPAAGKPLVTKKASAAPAIARKPASQQARHPVSPLARVHAEAPVRARVAAGKRKPGAPASRGKAKGRAVRPELHRVVARKATDRREPPPQHARSLHIAPAPLPVTPPAPPQRLDAIVYGMLALPDSVYAATSNGLMHSADDGQHWSAVDTLAMPEVRFVAGQKKMVLAGGLRRLALSLDSGTTWDTLPLPADLTQLSAMAVDELGNLWVGGAEGVYYSTDYGLNWKTLRNLFTTEVDGIFFDAPNHRVLVTTSNATIIFAAHLPDYKVSNWESGWHLRFVRPVGDHLIGATLYDGMVLQPRMVAPDQKPGSDKKTAEATPASPMLPSAPATLPAIPGAPVSAAAPSPTPSAAPSTLRKTAPATSVLPPTPPTQRP